MPEDTHAATGRTRRPRPADTLRSALLRCWRLAAAAAWLAAAGPLAAQAAPAEAAPERRQDGGVAYVSGGLDAAARQETLRLGRDMNLQLVFARVPSGIYLSDVAVAITNSRGETVFDLASADPLVSVQLEPGTYQVAATVHGQPLRRTVEVPRDGRRTEVFHWLDAAALIVPQGAEASSR